MTTIKVWSRNNNGTLIHAGEFESFDHAEIAARIWNRSAEATRVRAIV